MDSANFPKGKDMQKMLEKGLLQVHVYKNIKTGKIDWCLVPENYGVYYEDNDS